MVFAYFTVASNVPFLSKVSMVYEVSDVLMVGSNIVFNNFIFRFGADCEESAGDVLLVIDGLQRPANAIMVVAIIKAITAYSVIFIR